MSGNLADPKQIEAIPPSLLRTIPAAAPPPGSGIQPNFIDPPARVPVVLGAGIAYFVLASVCLTISIYMKVAIAKRWRWDDYKLLRRRHRFREDYFSGLYSSVTISLGFVS